MRLARQPQHQKRQRPPNEHDSAIGSVIFVLAQGYLQDLLRIASGLAKGIPFLPALLSPDRWLLWLGLMFVLAVYFFPQGIVGRLREKKAATRP